MVKIGSKERKAAIDYAATPGGRAALARLKSGLTPAAAARRLRWRQVRILAVESNEQSLGPADAVALAKVYGVSERFFDLGAPVSLPDVDLAVTAVADLPEDLRYACLDLFATRHRVVMEAGTPKPAGGGSYARRYALRRGAQRLETHFHEVLGPSGGIDSGFDTIGELLDFALGDALQVEARPTELHWALSPVFGDDEDSRTLARRDAIEAAAAFRDFLGQRLYRELATLAMDGPSAELRQEAEALLEAEDEEDWHRRAPRPANTGPLAGAFRAVDELPLNTEQWLAMYPSLTPQELTMLERVDGASIVPAGDPIVDELWHRAILSPRTMFALAMTLRIVTGELAAVSIEHRTICGKQSGPD